MELQEIESHLSKLKENLDFNNHCINYFKRELSDKQLIEYNPIIRTSTGKSSSNQKIIYRNWWFVSTDFSWFTRFLDYKFPDEDYKLNFFSLMGNHDNITNDMVGKKVFYSGECLNKNTSVMHFNQDFGSYALKHVDFAMGYDVLNHPKYLRFPLWLLSNFEPNSTEEDIENKIIEWNSITFEKSRNVTVVSSHDLWKTRTKICDDVEKVTHIDYAGRWRNNTSDLFVKFGDNKRNFLKEYKFNICAENVDDTGYVTEKIFDAISMDNIPLYIGGGNYLEPNVINSNKVLLWKMDEDNSDTLELFDTLVHDEKSFNEFKDQDAILNNSSKHIIGLFNSLEKHFERLIYD